MNEPLFTLETTPDGTCRSFADPSAAPIGLTPDERPPRPPLWVRLRAALSGTPTGRRRPLPVPR
jgi:hypothetical protein